MSSLLVLIGAVAFSKRKGGAFAEESEQFVAAESQTGVNRHRLLGRALMEERPSPIAYAIGGLLPIAVAAVLVGLRGEIAATNVALVLVLVVVGTAAFGGRGPAALSAIIAALSWEFFFTRPYNSLRIDSADDVETFLILLAIGLAVGQIAVFARHRQHEASRGRDELASMRRMAERVAVGASDRELIDLAVAELTELVVAASRCRFEVEATGPALPVLERSGANREPATAASGPTASSRCRRSASGSRSSAVATRWARSCSNPIRRSGSPVEARCAVACRPLRGLDALPRIDPSVAVTLASALAATIDQRRAPARRSSPRSRRAPRPLRPRSRSASVLRLRRRPSNQAIGSPAVRAESLRREPPNVWCSFECDGSQARRSTGARQGLARVAPEEHQGPVPAPGTGVRRRHGRHRVHRRGDHRVLRPVRRVRRGLRPHRAQRRRRLGAVSSTEVTQ